MALDRGFDTERYHKLLSAKNIKHITRLNLNRTVMVGPRRRELLVNDVYGYLTRRRCLGEVIHQQQKKTCPLELGYCNVQLPSQETRYVVVMVKSPFYQQPMYLLTNRSCSSIKDAQTMQWEGDSGALNPEAQGRWILHSGTERDFEKAYQGIEFFTRHDVGRLTITPSDIEKKQRKPEEMSYTELREFIDNQERAGQNVARWLVDYYSKMSFPCACLVVVLFGVPFSANRRRGVAVEFGISVAVTFIYLAFMKASQVFGYNGDLNPLLTAWLANGVFLTAGIVNLVRVNK